MKTKSANPLHNLNKDIATVLQKGGRYKDRAELVFFVK